MIVAGIEWTGSVLVNGEMIVDVLSDVRDRIKSDPNADHALAFAVAAIVPPDRIDEFITSLRAFSGAREEL